MRKTRLVSIALVCLVVLSLVYGAGTIAMCHADNSRPYKRTLVEPQDDSGPYGFDPIVEPQDNSRPYKK